MADYKNSVKAQALNWLILNAVHSSATFKATFGPRENRKLRAWDPVSPSKSLEEVPLTHMEAFPRPPCTVLPAFTMFSWRTKVTLSQFRPQTILRWPRGALSDGSSPFFLPPEKKQPRHGQRGRRWQKFFSEGRQFWPSWFYSFKLSFLLVWGRMVGDETFGVPPSHKRLLPRAGEEAGRWNKGWIFPQTLAPRRFLTLLRSAKAQKKETCPCFGVSAFWKAPSILGYRALT